MSIVPPVHHLVRFRKSQLAGLPLPPKSRVTSHGFAPKVTVHDRLKQHYHDTLATDLLLVNYKHNEKTIPGSKWTPRETTTPYALYQPARPPLGRSQATKDIKPRTDKNVPILTKISLNCFVKQAVKQRDHAIVAKVMLQQITGAKTSTVYAKTNIPGLSLRPGAPVGAKTTLTGELASQFLLTLTELVLPRSRTFTQIQPKTGDRNGNIAFKLTSHDISLFPELQYSLEMWPATFDVDVILNTTAQTDDEARTFLSALGFPVAGPKAVEVAAEK